MTIQDAIDTIKHVRVLKSMFAKDRGIPKDDKDGSFVNISHAVTVAEDAANKAMIILPLRRIDHYMVQIISAAGVHKTGDLKITKVGNNQINVEDGAVGNITATDIITIFARGLV